MRPPFRSGLARLLSPLLVLTLAACTPTGDRPAASATPVGSAPSSEAASLAERIAETVTAATTIPTYMTGPAISPDALTPVANTIVTIAAVVGSVNAAEKLLRLDGQNEGFSAIRLTPATRIVREDGKDGSLADLRAGQTVQAKGLPGKGGTLIARQVTISRGQ